MTNTSMTLPAITQVREHWGWFLALGIVFIVGGIFAIAAPVIASIAVALVAAWVFIVVGAVQTFQAWSLRSWGGFIWQMIIGLVVLIGGIAMLINPVVAAEALALLIGFMFLIKGIMQIMFSLHYRPYVGWGWILAAGILAIVLALMIVTSWPFSGLWVPGTLAGISLIFSGWSYVMIAWAGRRLASM
jgi:uncharacterized membrane protein HdeD (DUF308 family)